MTFAGQALFTLYILVFYGRASVTGDWRSANDVLPDGMIAGDAPGNAALFVHLLFSALITLAGLLQLIPRIRTRFPTFHRWNGRLYMLAAVIMSIGGLYIAWGRGEAGSGYATSINGVVILICALFATQLARSRDFLGHQTWAVRLFLAVSGVWFLRVFIMLWVLLFGPEHLGDDLGGPAGIALNYAQFIAPLLLFELYRGAKRSKRKAVHWSVAATLFLCSTAMGAGIGMAWLFLWLPNLTG
ncbi:MAG: DUF2306 domain-containing protein [Sphingopyxis sp.]|nr:DUF2306 domain-containing protein [Sphingopyxis sp.]